MNVLEIKLVVAEAMEAVEKSVDPTFSETLQVEIDKFLLEFIHVVGKCIDNCRDSQRVPRKIEEAANQLTECYSV